MVIFTSSKSYCFYYSFSFEFFVNSFDFCRFIIFFNPDLVLQGDIYLQYAFLGLLHFSHDRTHLHIVYFLRIFIVTIIELADLVEFKAESLFHSATFKLKLFDLHRFFQINIIFWHLWI